MNAKRRVVLFYELEDFEGGEQSSISNLDLSEDEITYLANRVIGDSGVVKVKYQMRFFGDVSHDYIIDEFRGEESDVIVPYIVLYIEEGDNFFNELDDYIEEHKIGAYFYC